MVSKNNDDLKIIGDIIGNMEGRIEGWYDLAADRNNWMWICGL